MKAVLIATDYIKTEDGNYKVLEINTNASLGVLRDDIDFLDFTELDNYITTNQFTTINIIYPAYNNRFRDKLVDMYNENTSITINSFETQAGSITVPYIEDNETALTIRLSYDTTAIIDDEYCKDKFNFIRALGSDTLKPKTYIYDICDDFSGMTELNYSAEEPNIIVKKRYPNYDKYEFPKLYKITSIEDLNDLKSSINNEIEYIQEYIPSEVVDNKHDIIRNIGIIYGSNLDVINLGGYRVKNSISNNLWSNSYDTTTKELDKKDRPKYITYTYNVDDRVNYIVDVNDEIVMGDNTTKLFNNLVVGDVVKSISIASLSDSEADYDKLSWSGSYTDFISNYSITSSIVEYKATSTEINDLFVQITLEDGIVWEDSPWSVILVKSDSDTIKFKDVNDLIVGDILQMVDISNNTIVSKTITNLEIIFKYNITLGDIDVEKKDIFLPLIANNLTLIQHNLCRPFCVGEGTHPSCLSYGQCNNCSFAQCQAK